jgi:hypothetical protein
VFALALELALELALVVVLVLALALVLAPIPALNPTPRVSAALPLRDRAPDFKSSASGRMTKARAGASSRARRGEGSLDAQGRA